MSMCTMKSDGQLCHIAERGSSSAVAEAVDGRVWITTPHVDNSLRELATHGA
jgi:hypothetical protein